MSKETCMYSTQGSYKCCPSGDVHCLYDFPVAAPNGMAPTPAGAADKHCGPPRKTMESFMPMKAPMHERFENSPVGLSSSYTYTCEAVSEAGGAVTTSNRKM